MRRVAFSGSFYAVVHYLSAQMEHLFGMIGKMVGDVTYRIEEKQSEETEKSLSEIFNLTNMSKCLDERILFTFKWLMNEKSGAIIRNRVSHGIMNPDEAKNRMVFLCCS